MLEKLNVRNVLQNVEVHLDRDILKNIEKYRADCQQFFKLIQIRQLS